MNSSINRRDFLKLTGCTMAACALGGEIKVLQAAEHEKLPPPISPGIFVVAPSTITTGEEFSIGVKVLTTPYAIDTPHAQVTREIAPQIKPLILDINPPRLASPTNKSHRGITYMDYVDPTWRGVLTISGSKGYAGPEKESFKDGKGPYPDDHRPIRKIAHVQFSEPGIHYVTVNDPATGLSGTSNPIMVSKNSIEEKLYWGDIHGHTIFTDGIRSPEEVYYFARDEAFLDFCALSDHTEYFSGSDPKDIWQYFVKVTNHFNAPGRFVTLLGQEWSHMKLGHRNLYYPGNTAPYVSCRKPWDTLPALYKVAHAHGALVIPHHTASASMGVTWELGHDPEVERLAEIYSVWGNSERHADDGNPKPIRFAGGEKESRHVMDALAMGRKYGIIASGDVHDGRLGDHLMPYQTKPDHYKLGYRGGLVGAWAKNLTRESIFDALWNRRVFGTTGPRIHLRFSIAGSPMGSEVKATKSLPVEVEVASEVPITRIDLVGDGKDRQSHKPNSREVTWKIELARKERCSWYYVRITRQDGEMAWSSPIWINENS